MNSSPALQVLLVDDDDDVRSAIATGLRLAGFDTIEAADGHRALAQLANRRIGTIVSDIRMPMLDGRQLLQRVRAIDADLPVILITGHGDIEQAVDAVRNGAYDFLAKPFASDRLADAVARALDLRLLVLENRQLRASMGAADERQPNPLIGTSTAITGLLRTIEQIGSADINILIEGERGTGKRAVAGLLHRAGKQGRTAARVLRCDILSEQAVHDALRSDPEPKGDRPRASRTKPGAPVARTDTLILDAVDALSTPSQARLLHFLHQRDPDDGGLAGHPAVQVAGQATGQRPRIISTSINSLSAEVQSGRFRADLYYKLAPVKLEVPPLRARMPDIPALFAHMLVVTAERFDRPVPAISDAILAHLANHDWPGNLRELHNFAEQVVLNLEKAELALTAETLSLAQRVALFERETILGALRTVSGDVPQCCAKLDIPRKTLYDKIARHGIDLQEIRDLYRQDR